MIFYFTGTGNSLESAQIIAQLTNDTLTDLGAATKAGTFDFIVEQGDALGFVFPVYAWSTPGIVDNFIAKMNLITPAGDAFVPGYCFVVVSCGAWIGNTARYFGKLLHQAQNITLDASFSVKSVDNCVYLADPPQGEKQAFLLEDARRLAREAATSIAAQEHVHREVRHPLGIVFSLVTCRPNKQRSTENFFTTEACIGCGDCARLCPTNTIVIREGRPRWSEGNCTQCLACLNRCRTHAIQYGKKTEARGRYINPVLTK
ncbi:MAG: EFR1 family ferrodoxin [Raoultibacter sp.]